MPSLTTRIARASASLRSFAVSGQSVSRSATARTEERAVSFEKAFARAVPAEAAQGLVPVAPVTEAFLLRPVALQRLGGRGTGWQRGDEAGRQGVAKARHAGRSPITIRSIPARSRRVSA